MNAYLIWLLAGLALIIAELLSGTFYLLFLGLAALLGGVAAYFGAGFAVQASIAALAAVSGVLWVQRSNSRRRGERMPALDIGQSVTWENWVNPDAGVGQVRYRGALWEARIETGVQPSAGEVLYIVDVIGNSLRVAKQPAD